MLPYTVKNPKSQWRRSGDFAVNFENIYLPNCSSVSIVNFEQVIAGRERTCQFYFYVACYLYVTESF